MGFEGRVALVTGGTGALGQAVVPALAAAGATVVVPYRDPDAFAAQQVALGDLGGRVLGRQADVTDEGEVARLVEVVLAEQGRIDFLLNLVGGYAGGRFLDTDVGLWDRMLRLNFRSTLLCTRAVLPHLVARGSGRVVTMGARSALEPSAGSDAYAAAKAAVVSMTQSLGRELRATGVTINCVAPSTIDTEANRRMMPKADPSRWVKPADIAALIAYLCSEAGAAVNGAVIPIYGQA
ncbi:MAG TPA: SDR family NAD(P)-dependent oxidoreductase [Thermomicrobiaceae bacterium]|nr:SDR family NAD(P)-dependent oxidoreductase [Thermomicrobiaceae bacterium]